jgi:LysR family cyn operon transcriptional activator
MIGSMRARPAMKYRQLQYFLEVAQTLHFSKAAENLFVTQPTLSHQLSELENRIGMPLFDRTGGTVRLTQAGSILREYAKRSIDAVEEGCTALAELGGLQRGDLKLGVTQSFIRRQIPPIIAQFRSRYPAIQLHISDLNANQIERQLAEGTIHLGIAFVPATMEDTEVESILDERLVLLVNRNHPLASAGQVSWGELASYPLVLLNRSYSTRQMIDDYFSEAGVQQTVACETNTIDLMIGLAAATDLATILPEHAVDPSADMAVLSIIDPEPTRTSAIMWPRHRYRTLGALAFAEILKECFASRASIL